MIQSMFVEKKNEIYDSFIIINIYYIVKAKTVLPLIYCYNLKLKINLYQFK